MRELNVNHETDSVSGAFAGEEKIDRLLDNLVEITKEGLISNRSVSKMIQQAVELYADTTEEAIGIALSIHNAIMNAKGRRDEKMHDLMQKFSDFSKSRFDTPFGGMLDAMLHGEEGIEDAPDEAILDHLNNVDCTTCELHGSCDIESIAKKRGLL